MGLFLGASQAECTNFQALSLRSMRDWTRNMCCTDYSDNIMGMQDTLVGPTFAGDDNKWLGSPQATLMGMYNGNMSSVLLQLNA